jgi:protein SCO1/2
VKRYHLKGKVISVDATHNSLTIDHEAIPGFMNAMTMTYFVRSAQSLAGLDPGDEITADIVVPENGPAYLENIVAVRKGAGIASVPTRVSGRVPLDWDSEGDRSSRLPEEFARG